MRQFVESLKRLYHNSMIDDKKINELCNANKISKDEKEYILN